MYSTPSMGSVGSQMSTLRTAWLLVPAYNLAARQLKTIGQYAFYRRTTLTTVNILDSVVTIDTSEHSCVLLCI